jgi:hypothetical protein
LSILKWLHEHECPWTSAICARAAEKGHWVFLKWLNANGCPWDEETSSQAAKCGRLDILKWARQENCPWNAFTTNDAIETGNMNVYKWAKSNGCPVRRTPDETRAELCNAFMNNIQRSERPARADARVRFMELPER